MEQNQNRNFYDHIFNSIFLLIRHSSVFQIISWNWKHLTKRKVQAKKVLWQLILHNQCATLCVSFSESNKCFSNSYCEIASTWLINSSKIEIVLSGDSKELFVQSVCVNFWSKSKARGGAKSKNRHPTWICCTVVGLPEAVIEVF